ncbi:MAG: hypothetical protein AB1765_13175, partial [Candidatus Hydrogenedentota bacterium]
QSSFRTDTCRDGIIVSKKVAKSYNLRVSSGVVHKRITSQNMPIREDKRTSSVILSYTPYGATLLQIIH